MMGDLEASCTVPAPSCPQDFCAQGMVSDKGQTEDQEPTNKAVPRFQQRQVQKTNPEVFHRNMATSLMTWLNIMLKHTTLVGRVCLPVLFIMRVLTLLLAENSVWRNEESFIKCATKDPLCRPGCFNQINPITHPQYWFFQLILVTAPTLLWMFCFLTHPRLGASTVAEENRLSNNSSPENISSSKKVPSPSKIYYILSLLFKLILEICFLAGQWYVIGFEVSNRYQCRYTSCAFTVDCFYPNAMKKKMSLSLLWPH